MMPNNEEGFMDDLDHAVGKALTDALSDCSSAYLPPEIFHELNAAVAEYAKQEVLNLPKEELQDYVSVLVEGYSMLSAVTHRMRHQLTDLHAQVKEIQERLDGSLDVHLSEN